MREESIGTLHTGIVGSSSRKSAAAHTKLLVLLGVVVDRRAC